MARQYKKDARAEIISALTVILNYKDNLRVAVRTSKEADKDYFKEQYEQACVAYRMGLKALFNLRKEEQQQYGIN